MLSFYLGSGSRFLEAFTDNTSRLPPKYPGIILALSSLLGLWAIWRFYKFTILPVLYPDEVREVPYWIPYVGNISSSLFCITNLGLNVVTGHVISFVKDSNGLLTHATELFRSRRPFRINLGGEIFNVLTSPRDVAEAYKNTTTLSFDGFMDDIMVSCGVSRSTIAKMWLSPQDGFQAPIPNPDCKCLAQLMRDFHRLQLLHEENQKDLNRRFIDDIDRALQWHRLKSLQTGTYKHAVDGVHVDVFLKQWCGDVLVNAATRAFFGDALLEISPDLVRNFFTFDENSWKLIYRVPRFLARDLYRGMNATVDGMTKYFELPKERRSGEAYFVRIVESAMKDLAIGERDIAKAFLLVYWVVNANTYKLCFWILSYLVHDTDLMTAIEDETNGAFDTGTLNMPFLLDCCPRVNALFDEVMRITNSSASVRTVVSDTRIGGSILRSGTKVMIPYRQLHFDQDVWRPRAKEMDPARFLNDKNMSRSPSYRPFGGGSSYCPGRFIARQEVLAFIACVLRRFKITRLSTAGIPRLDEWKPCIGVMGPVAGADVLLRVEERKFP